MLRLRRKEESYFLATQRLPTPTRKLRVLGAPDALGSIISRPMGAWTIAWTISSS